MPILAISGNLKKNVKMVLFFFEIPEHYFWWNWRYFGEIWLIFGKMKMGLFFRKIGDIWKKNNCIFCCFRFFAVLSIDKEIFSHEKCKIRLCKNNLSCWNSRYQNHEIFRPLAITRPYLYIYIYTSFNIIPITRVREGVNRKDKTHGIKFRTHDCLASFTFT